jgi:hypothetical protein
MSEKGMSRSWSQVFAWARLAVASLPASSGCFEDAQHARTIQGMATGAGTQLDENVLEVPFNRFVAYSQCEGDLLVGHAGCQQLECLLFLGSQQ